jgi:hypothetical protein
MKTAAVPKRNEAEVRIRVDKRRHTTSLKPVFDSTKQNYVGAHGIGCKN